MTYPAQTISRMKPTWVVAANSVRARIFARASGAPSLTEVETLLHPESRLHERELTSDLPGRTFDRAGGARHIKEARSRPKRVEQIGFAAALTKRLKHAYDEGSYEHIIISAPPRFLGDIRTNLQAEVAGSVTWITKDLSRLTPRELSKRIQAYIEKAG